MPTVLMRVSRSKLNKCILNKLIEVLLIQQSDRLFHLSATLLRGYSSAS